MIRRLLTTALAFLVITSEFRATGFDADEIADLPWRILGRNSLNVKLPLPFIEGGELVNDREFPWMASVRVSGYHFCDGIIFNSDWILGAASCMFYNWKAYSVQVGTNSLDTGGTVHTVTEVVMHEAYNESNSWINDIVLLKVSPQIEMSDGVSPAILSGKGQVTPVGTPAVIAGWGALKITNKSRIKTMSGDLVHAIAEVVRHEAYNESNSWVNGIVLSEYFDFPANDLHKLDVEVYDHKKCEEAYAPIPKKVIYPTQICAASKEDKKGPTNGDAGAPLMVDGRVVGLTSWERNVNELGYPAVFTEVSHYIDWISSHVKGSEE